MPALNLPTNLALVEAWAGALYGSAVGQTTMAQVNSDIVTYGGLNNTLNAYYSAAFGSMSTTAIGTMVAANVGLTGTTATTAAQIITATLNATAPAARGAAINSMLNTFSGLTADTTWGAGAIAWNTTVNTEVTYNLSNATDNTLAVAATTVTSQTAAAAAAATAAAAAATAAATAKLTTFTTGVDSLVGTSGNDTFTATATTWNAGDTISGNGGADTLNATLNGAGPQQSATSLTGVQTINLTASPNPSSIDLTGVTGVTSINNINSANGATLAVTGLGAVANSTITGGNTSTTITYTTAAVAGTADAATLTLNGVNAGSSYVTSGVETLTVASATGANTLTTLTDTGITRLNITGSQALTITGTVGGTTLTTVNASADTGALTLTVAGAGTTAAPTGVTFTGGSGATTLTTGGFNDTVTEGNGNNTVNTGAGNDTITTGTGTNTTTPGTGNDTITLNGTDTVRFAEAGATNADVINGFSLTSNDVISLNLGAAQLAATSTVAAQTASAGTFGVLQTGTLSPVLANVNGLGTTTTLAAQIINANATATTGTTVLGTSNVLFLNGAFTDGTAQGVINALGTTATTGITTTTNGKFILVSYSVGNVAQIWSYGGDTGTANSDIDASELSLVATLNGVSANTLTAAAFSTYLTTPTASTTVSNTGQTITLSGLLNTVTTSPNANGQFLTSGADTINVNIGSTPTAAANSTTQGLTVLDNTAGDGDTLNATVLNQNWDLNTTLTNIENVNLTLTNSDTDGFVASTTMPGTTTLTFLGTGNEGATGASGISGFTSGNTIGLGASFSGLVNLRQGATLAAVTLNLGGNSFTTSATSPTFTTDNTITALTVNANASGAVNLNLTNVTAATLAGAGNVTLFTTAALLGSSTVNASGAGYTGALTLRPSTDATMNFADASAFTGIRTIDFSDIAAFSSAVTFAAANNSTAYGSGAININFAPTASSALNTLNTSILGAGTTDALNVTLGANATAITNALTATGFETVAISSSAAATVTPAIGGVTLFDGAGTQSVTVTNALGGFTLGTVVADTLTTTGVTGAVSATLGNTSSGAVFSGGNGNTTITGTGLADQISVGSGTNVITGGAGSDSIILAASHSNVSKIVFSGAAAGLETAAAGTAAAALTADLNANGSDTISNFNSAVDTLNIVALTSTTATITAGTAITSAAAQGALTTDKAIVINTTGAAANLTTGGSATITDFTNKTQVAAYLAERFTTTAKAQFDDFIINNTSGTNNTSYVYVLDHIANDTSIAAADLILVGTIIHTPGSALTAANVVFA